MTTPKRPVWLGEDRRGWDHVRVHVHLILDQKVGAHAMAVYLGLVKHAELGSGQTFVALETLHDYTGLSRRSVQRAITTLSDAGYVEVESRQGKTSLFRLPAPPTPHSHGSISGTHASESEPVTTHSQGTPDQNAYEQDPLNKNQGTRVKPFGPPSAGRERDPLWPPLMAACGLEAAALTKSARGAANKALAEIRDAGATADDIASRAAAYRKRYPKATLTPSALAKHWPQLDDDQAVPQFESGRLREVG